MFTPLDGTEQRFCLQHPVGSLYRKSPSLLVLLQPYSLPHNPNFTAHADNPNPYGINFDTFPYYNSNTVADIDRDGDFGLMYADEIMGGSIWWQQNTGTALTPNFAAGANMYMDFSLPSASEPGGIAFADMDDDNDLDAFIGDGQYLYYVPNNAASPDTPDFGTTAPPSGMTQFTEGNMSICAADMNGDGDYDLIVCHEDNSNNTTLQYFENTGSAISYSFGAPVQLNDTDSNPISFTGRAMVTAADIDLIVSNSSNNDAYIFVNTNF